MTAVPKKPILIAFGSKARVGKDSVCEYIKQGYGAESVRFATPVYELCELIQDYIGVEKQKNGTLLQVIGMGVRKAYDDHIWVNIARAKIEKFIESGKNVVIPDLRFPHEKEMLEKLGFIVVRINRKDRIIDRDPNCESETALDSHRFDYEVYNDETLPELYKKIDDIIAEQFG